MPIFFVSLSLSNRLLKCKSNKSFFNEFYDPNLTGLNPSKKIKCIIKDLHHH